MTSHVEGTLTLDGLLEGNLPLDQGHEKLEEWVALLSKVGLRLNLRIDGNRFSVFAESVTISAKDFGADPAEQLKDSLQQLVDAIGSVEEHELFSTLRSVEFQPGTEVQTVYILRADGTVDTQQERLVAETVAPAKPLSGKQKVKLFGGTLLILLMLFLLSTCVIDYGALWDKVSPLDTTTIEVDNAAFDAWFEVDKIEAANRSQSLRITLTRTPAYPTDLATQRALDPKRLEPPHSIRAHAVLTGYVRCELFDKDGRLIGSAQVRTRSLETEETVVVELRIPRDPRPTKLVFTP